MNKSTNGEMWLNPGNGQPKAIPLSSTKQGGYGAAINVSIILLIVTLSISIILQMMLIYYKSYTEIAAHQQVINAQEKVKAERILQQLSQNDTQYE